MADRVHVRIPRSLHATVREVRSRTMEHPSHFLRLGENALGVSSSRPRYVANEGLEPESAEDTR